VVKNKVDWDRLSVNEKVDIISDGIQALRKVVRLEWMKYSEEIPSGNIFKLFSRARDILMELQSVLMDIIKYQEEKEEEEI